MATTEAPLPPKALEIRKERTNSEGTADYLVLFSDSKSGRAKWVSEATLNRPDLVSEFKEKEKKRTEKEKQREEKKKEEPKADHKTKQNAQESKTKGERKIKDIIGMVKAGTEPEFLVEFKDSDKPEIVDGSYLRKHHPKLLVSFYEAHIKLISTDEKPETVHLEAAPVLPQLPSSEEVPDNTRNPSSEETAAQPVKQVEAAKEQP